MKIVPDSDQTYYEKEEEAYHMEVERFFKEVECATDEELLTVMRYAIVHHYVPNIMVDPMYDTHCMLGMYLRSSRIFDAIENRGISTQIYPDSAVLREYVTHGHMTGAPYKDTITMQKIIEACGSSEHLDSVVGEWEDTLSMWYKFYGAPIMKEFYRKNGKS